MGWLKKIFSLLAVPIQAIATAFFKVRAEEKKAEQAEKDMEDFDEALKTGDPDAIRTKLDELVRKPTNKKS